MAGDPQIPGEPLRFCRIHSPAPWGCPRAHLDHEAVLLAVVGHEDDVAVGGPDEARQAQRGVRAGRGRLHRRNLVGLDTAQLRSRVEHADAAQQRGVHLLGHRG